MTTALLIDPDLGRAVSAGQDQHCDSYRQRNLHDHTTKKIRLGQKEEGRHNDPVSQGR